MTLEAKQLAAAARHSPRREAAAVQARTLPQEYASPLHSPTIPPQTSGVWPCFLPPAAGLLARNHSFSLFKLLVSVHERNKLLMATADGETAAVLVDTDDSEEDTLLLTHVRPAAPTCTQAHAQEAKEQLTGCPAVLMAGEGKVGKVRLNEYKDSAKDEAGNAGGKGPPMCALKDCNRACPWDTKYYKRWKFCTAAQEAKELREVEARAGAEMLFPLLETAVWEAHAELLRERAGGEREGADMERAEAPNCVPLDTVPTSPAVPAGTAMRTTGKVAAEASAAAEMLFPLVEAAVWEAYAELLREREGGEEGAKAEAPNFGPGDANVFTSATVCAQCDCRDAVTARCAECGVLCEGCATAHGRMKCLSRHKVSPLKPEAARQNKQDGQEADRDSRRRLWHWRWSESVPLPKTSQLVPQQQGPDGSPGSAAERVWSVGGEQGLLNRPRSVALGMDGLVYVCDDNEKGKVHVLRGADGVLVRRIGGECGSGEGVLDCPMGVAVDENHVYVSDYTSHRVQVFRASDGKFLTSLGAAGSGPGQLLHPAALALDGRGSLHVADTGNNRIVCFDTGHRSGTAF